MKSIHLDSFTVVAQMKRSSTMQRSLTRRPLWMNIYHPPQEINVSLLIRVKVYHENLSKREVQRIKHRNVPSLLFLQARSITDYLIEVFAQMTTWWFESVDKLICFDLSFSSMTRSNKSKIYKIQSVRWFSNTRGSDINWMLKQDSCATRGWTNIFGPALAALSITYTKVLNSMS